MSQAKPVGPGQQLSTLALTPKQTRTLSHKLRQRQNLQLTLLYSLTHNHDLSHPLSRTTRQPASQNNKTKNKTQKKRVNLTTRKKKGPNHSHNRAHPSTRQRIHTLTRTILNTKNYGHIQQKKTDRNDCYTKTKHPSAEYLSGAHSSLARIGLSDTLENVHTVVLGRNKLLSTTTAGS